ncbi:MAG: hypothetical protein AAGA65_16285 [Actinomycetota bacterium]
MPARPPSRLLWLVPAAAMLAAACGELTPPEAYSPTTSTTLVDGAEPQIDSQVEEAPDVVERVDEFVPPPPPDYVPTLLVSGANYLLGAREVAGETEGTIASASAALIGELGTLATQRAVDDLGGGLVVQENDGAIVYRPAAGEPEVLLEAGTGARLLDVGYWDGSPRAFIEVATGTVDRIQLVSEPGSELQQQMHFELEDDQQIVSFSASRDLQAVIIQDGQCGQLWFFNAQGSRLGLPQPEAPECVFPGRPTFGAVALSPDGGAIAYTIVTYRGDGSEAATALFAREIFPEDRLFANRKIDEVGDAITALAFDGERAAYVRVAGEQQFVTVLDLTVENSEVAVDLLDVGAVRSVSFARNPIIAVG